MVALALVFACEQMTLVVFSKQLQRWDRLPSASLRLLQAQIALFSAVSSREVLSAVYEIPCQLVLLDLPTLRAGFPASVSEELSSNSLHFSGLKYLHLEILIHVDHHLASQTWLEANRRH